MKHLLIIILGTILTVQMVSAQIVDTITCTFDSINLGVIEHYPRIDYEIGVAYDYALDYMCQCRPFQTKAYKTKIHDSLRVKKLMDDFNQKYNCNSDTIIQHFFRMLVLEREKQYVYYKAYYFNYKCSLVPIFEGLFYFENALYNAGVYKEYDNSGMLRLEGNFILSKKVHKKEKTYNTYECPVKDGKWFYYNKKRQLLRKEEYKNGKLNKNAT